MSSLRTWTSAGAVSLVSNLVLAVAVSAATLTWDTNTGTTGAQGGNGTWTNLGTGNNWWNGTVNRPWSNAAPDAAIFPSSAGTVSLAGAISASGLTFQANYLIRSNALTLVTPGLITVDSGLSTIGSTLLGAILAKGGAGTLALTVNATNTGTATVSAGVLRLTNSGSLFNNGATAGTLTIAPGGTLSLSRSDAFGNHSSTPALTVNLDTNGLIENVATFTTFRTLTFRGGELRANGGASANFEAYQLKGPVTVNADTMSRITGPGGVNGFTGVQLGNNNAGGQTLITVSDGTAPVDFSVETALIDGRNTASTAFVPSGFIKEGPGRMELSGNNRFSGIASVNNGVLALGAAGTISNGTVDVAPGSVFDVTAVAGFSMPAGMTIQGSGVVTGSVTTADGARLLPGSPVGAGTLTIAGDLVLSGTSGYTNAFDLTNSLTVGGGVNDLLDVAGFLAPNGSPILVNARAPLAGGTYSLIRYSTLDSGTAFGPVLGNSYRDVWTLNTNDSGWIKLDVTPGVAQALRWLPGTENGDWNLATSNWVDQSTSTVTDRFYDLDSVLFDEAGAYSNTVNLTATVRPASVTVDGASNYVFTGSGRIGDAPATATLFTKSGTGTLVVHNTNDYTGGTLVSNGMLQVGNSSNSGALGPGPIRTVAGSTLAYFRSDGALNIAQALRGDGTLLLLGTGVTNESGYQFTGINTGFVGTVVVTNARFHADSANDIGNAAVIKIQEGGGLYQPGGTFGRPIEIAGIGWLEGSGRLGAMRIDNATWTGSVTLTANARIAGFSNNGTITGPVSGPYELEIWAGNTARSITLTPPVPNTYAALRVSSNGIAVAGNTNAYSSGPVIMNGGTQRLNGLSFAFSNLTSTAAGGNIQNSHATLPATFIVGLDDSSTAYGGVFANGNAGVLNVTKVGAGTLTLNGANVNSGSFTIQSGALALGSVGTLASSSTVVLAGGRLDTTSKGVFTPNFPIQGSGALVGPQLFSGGAVLLPGGAGAAGTITVTGSLNMAATFTNRFDLSTDPLAVGGGTNDLIAVTGGLEPGNSLIAVSYAVPPADGSYTLFTYTGSKFSSFNPAPAGNGTRATWTLVETNAGTINLEVSGSGSYLGLKWNPQVSSNWDVNAGANWLDLAGLTNTVFFDGDTVLFDDSGAITSAVNLVGVLRPASITVTSGSDYSLTGPGRISGATGLTKDGAGTLSLAGATHDFGGSVVISGGVVKATPAYVLPTNAPVSVSSGATLQFDAAAATGYTNFNAIGGAGSVLLTFAAGGNNNVYLQGVSTGFTGQLELAALGVTGNKLNSQGLNIAPTAKIKVNDGAQLFLAGTSLTNPVSIVGAGNSENRGALRLTTAGGFLAGPVTLLGNASLGLENAGISGDITNGVATPSVLTFGTANSGQPGLFSGTIADGAGVLTVVVSNGTPTLTGTNTYSGGTVFRGGTLVANTISDTGVSSIGNTGDLTFNGGGLRYIGADLAGTARTITNIGTATLDISNAAATLVLSGPLGGPGLITKAGFGTVVLSNVNYTTTNGYAVRNGTLVFDGGSYTSTAPNIGDLIGNTAGESARLILTNDVQYAKTEILWGASAASATGQIWMHSGTVRAGSIRMGNATPSAGAFYQLGGSSYASGEIDAGYNGAGAYGFILLAGGAMSNSNWQQASRFGVGLFYLTGGSDSILTSGNGFVAANNNGTGVFYFAGSTITNAGRLGIGWTGTSRGEVNVMAGTVPATNVGVQFNQQAGGTAIGVLNLKGGTLQTPTLFKQNAGGYSVVNLDGGTIEATASMPLLGPTGGTTGAVDAVYVRAGGAAFDSSNYAVTVAQPLLAPTGNGVTALPAVPANAGYIGAPYVEIRGGGGNGATAVALFDPASGSVTGLVLTSPGVGYTLPPTVTLVGGGPLTNTLLGTASIGAQGSGGLTKLGSGGLFLNSANTYTGLTTVAAGTLGGTGSIAGAVAVSESGALGAAPVLAPTGTLTIAGSVTLTNGSMLSAFLRGSTPTLVIAGDLNTWATNPVQVARADAVTVGTHVLVDYAGTFGGDTNNLQLVAVPNGGQGYLQVNTIDSTIELVVTNAGAGMKWDGAVNAAWENGGPANWRSIASGTLAPFSPYDDVLFDDTATGAYDVNLAELVQPGSLLVDNATSNYTFSGAGLAGPVALVKNGAAQLTLAGTQGHTGGTLLNTGTVRLASAAAAGPAGASITFNGGVLAYGLDAPGNAYAGILANNATVVLDRATSGAGITNAIGALTASGNFAIDVVAGPNVTSGEAWLTQGGAFSANGRTVTYNIGPSVVYNQTGAFPGGAQTVGVIKNGEGRLILAGNSDTWDNPSPAIQLNAGALELRRAPGDATDARTIDAASNTTLTLNQSVATHFYSTLNVKDSMTVVSERTTAGAGLTHVLRLLNFPGTNVTLTVLAGGNVTNGTAGVTFNTTTLGTGTTINVVNPVDTNVVTVASITGIVSGVDLSLTKTGSGTLTLKGPGAMTYSGGTIVNEGVLNLSYFFGSANIGTIRGELTINTGAVVRGIEKSLGFPASASGNVSKVTINGGLLEHVGNGGIGGGQTYILNAGEIRSNLGVPSTTSPCLRIGGGGTNDNGIYVLAAATPSVISGRIGMDAPGRFDVADGAADADLLVTASITDGIGTGNPPNGFIKTNSGTMVLNAPSTYKGVTSVDGGTLLVNNGSGLGTGTNALLVGAAGTLGGTGLVGGTVTSDGIVAPGASAGTLTISGDYIQNAGGALAIELGGTSAGVNADLLVVSNSVALSGGLSVSLINGYVPATNDVFLIVDGAAIGGTFGSLSLPALAAGQGWEVQYLPGEVILTITGGVSLTGYDLAATVITNGLSGYNDDADGDGYANLLEYVTGGSLTNADTNARMSGGRTNNVLALKFLRDTAATDATLYVEGSYTATNNADWVGIATNIGGSWGGSPTNVTESGASPVNVTVQDTISTATNRFLRLRVTRP